MTQSDNCTNLPADATDVYGDRPTLTITVERLQQLEIDRDRFYGLVNRERCRHLTKWGVQSHSLDVWAVILGEEFGEFLQAVNDIRIKAHGGDSEGSKEATQQAIKELVETAAVASAIFEEFFEPVELAEQLEKESTSESDSSI